MESLGFQTRLKNNDSNNADYRDSDEDHNVHDACTGCDTIAMNCSQCLSSSVTQILSPIFPRKEQPRTEQILDALLVNDTLVGAECLSVI